MIVATIVTTFLCNLGSSRHQLCGGEFMRRAIIGYSLKTWRGRTHLNTALMNRAQVLHTYVYLVIYKYPNEFEITDWYISIRFATSKHRQICGQKEYTTKQTPKGGSYVNWDPSDLLHESKLGRDFKHRLFTLYLTFRLIIPRWYTSERNHSYYNIHIGNTRSIYVTEIDIVTIIWVIIA